MPSPRRARALSAGLSDLDYWATSMTKLEVGIVELCQDPYDLELRPALGALQPAA